MLPGPWETTTALYHCREELILHLLYSLWRLAAGLLAAIAAGLPIGILMGAVPRADAGLSGIFYIGGPLPKAALLPILLLFFGVGGLSKIVLVFLITFFPLVLAVRDGVKSLSPGLLDPYKTAGAGWSAIFWNIWLPASLPGLFTVLRNGLSAGVSILFLAETYGTRYGMGFFIMDRWVRLDYGEMLGGIILMGLLGFMLTKGLDMVERKICTWK